MLNEILIPIIKEAIQLANVYDVDPPNKVLPYGMIKSEKNKKWANLINQGIESNFVCEIYVSEINMQEMLKMIENVKNAITNPSLVLKYPEIVYLNFDNYKIRQDNLILIGSVYFHVLKIESIS